MADQRIVAHARTQKPQTFYIVDENGDPFPLTGFTYKLYVHDAREETDGDNIVDGATMSVVDEAGGELRYVFTESNLDVTATAEVDATWQILLDNTGSGGDYKDLTDPEPMTIRRNRVLPALP